MMQRKWPVGAIGRPPADAGPLELREPRVANRLSTYEVYRSTPVGRGPTRRRDTRPQPKLSRSYRRVCYPEKCWHLSEA